MRKGANFLRWILTVFMVISAIVFFPSVSSVLCLLFAVLAAPSSPCSGSGSIRSNCAGAARRCS